LSGDGEVSLETIIHGFFKTRRFAACCLCDKTAVLYDTARIINNLKKREAVKIGAFTHIRGELLTFAHGGKIEIGDYCYVGTNTYIWSGKSIRIGNRVLIGHHCNIFDNDTHPFDPRERHAQFKQIITSGQPQNIDLKDEEVKIEDDVFIAANVTILKGVLIGRAAIVGAGSVVTKNVAPSTVIAGNPARLIREIPFAE
jgi:acetyltransferase-like isoleucine patch superfamily enzyme